MRALNDHPAPPSTFRLHRPHTSPPAVLAARRPRCPPSSLSAVLVVHRPRPPPINRPAATPACRPSIVPFALSIRSTWNAALKNRPIRAEHPRVSGLRAHLGEGNRSTRVATCMNITVIRSKRPPSLRQPAHSVRFCSQTAIFRRNRPDALHPDIFVRTPTTRTPSLVCPSPHLPHLHALRLYKPLPTGRITVDVRKAATRPQTHPPTARGPIPRRSGRLHPAGPAARPAGSSHPLARGPIPPDTRPS